MAQSSVEAEFQALAQGIFELLWLKIILEDLKIKWDGPINLYCDNKSSKRSLIPVSFVHLVFRHNVNLQIYSTKHLVAQFLKELCLRWECKIPIHQLDMEC